MSVRGAEARVAATITAADLAERLGARRSGKGYACQCPAHDDRQASLSIGEGADGRVLLRCFAGCEVEAVVERLGLSMRDLFPEGQVPRVRQGGTIKSERPAPPPLSEAQVERMASALRQDPEAWHHVTAVLRLSPEVVASLKLGLRVDHEERKWLAYPYRRGEGWSHANCRSLDGPKDFRRYPSGQATTLYRGDTLEPGGTAILLEGERDVAAGLTLGLGMLGSVVGMPGVNQVKLAAQALADQGLIFVGTDADPAGDKAAEELGAKLGPERCRRLRFPGFKDLGDLLSSKGGLEEAGRVAREAIDAARASPPPLPPKRAAKRSPAPSVEPANEPQNTALLLGEIRDAFKRHVILPPGASEVLALWCLHTWALDAARHTPRIVLKSPAKRCGKTLTLQVMQAFSRRPLLAANLSAAVMFRAIDAWQPTLLVDEADSFLADNEELRGIINAGFEMGGAVLRCDGEKHEPKNFVCYAPVAIASINNVPGTIADRALTLDLARKPKGTTVARFDRRAREALAGFGPRLARWAEDTVPALRDATPGVPSALNDRQRDICEPLLAIADIAGGAWPQVAREAILQVCAIDETDDLRERLLGEVWRLFGEPGTDFLSLKVIVERLVQSETGGWDTVDRGKQLSTGKLARWLRGFGLIAVQSRQDADRRRGYLRQEFADVAARYLDSFPGNGVTGVTGVTRAENIDVQRHTAGVTGGVTGALGGVTPQGCAEPVTRSSGVTPSGGVTLEGPSNGRCHAVTPHPPALEEGEGPLSAETIWGAEELAAAVRQVEAAAGPKSPSGGPGVHPNGPLTPLQKQLVRQLRDGPVADGAIPDFFRRHAMETLAAKGLAERQGDAWHLRRGAA